MTVALVRTIIADPYQFDEAELEGDGVRRQFPLPNAPVADSTVSVTLDGVPQSNPTHYQIALQLGLITFVTPPGIGQVVSCAYQFSLLSDDDIDAILTLEGDNDRLAAAMALDTIASSEALIQKRIKLLDLETDGPAVSRALREHAKALRDRDDDVTAESEGLFDYAEMSLSPFNRSKLWWKQHGRFLGE